MHGGKAAGCGAGRLTGKDGSVNSGGDGGIRTPDKGLGPYNGLANRRLQPLGHVSGSRKLIAAAFAADKSCRILGVILGTHCDPL